MEEQSTQCQKEKGHNDLQNIHVKRSSNTKIDWLMFNVQWAIFRYIQDENNLNATGIETKKCDG